MLNVSSGLGRCKAALYFGRTWQREAVVTSVIDLSAQPAVRHYLTLLFSDVCGSTDLAGKMEAEDYAEILREFNHACNLILPRHGGTIARIQGDGVLAVFGLPEVLADDARRAAEAALELHAAVRGLEILATVRPARAIRLHTGIHAGLVLMAPGDLMRGRFELTGDTPNIAARLAARARADEILVSAAALGPERSHIVIGEKREVEIDGPQKTLVVVPVLARASADPRLRPIQPPVVKPIVGRNSEIERLERALREAIEGRSVNVAISASAGVGKTRLAEHFLRDCVDMGCRVHRGYCGSYLTAEPLQPFVQILQALFDVGADTPARTAAQRVRAKLRKISPEFHLLDALLDLMSIGRKDVSNSGTRRSVSADMTSSALCTLFESLARTQTQVLFLDDWQWADDATHRMLDAITQSLKSNVLTLVTTRGATTGLPALYRSQLLDLQPLSNDESANYIAQLLPKESPFLVDQIRHSSGGNPLFIEELCHFAADDAEVRRTGRLQRGAAWLNVLVASRLSRLQEAQAKLVREAAIIGNVMPAWLFEDLTRHSVDAPAVRELALLDFVFPGEQAGTLRFKHAITREAVYDSVGLHDRRALHLRIAQALLQRSSLTGEDHCEALAYHFDGAGVADEAARYAEQAGDKAMAASALDRAQSHYRAALAALDRLAPSEVLALRWNSVSQRLGLACVFNPVRSELPIFQRALALAESSGNAGTIARATYWLGYIHYALGDARQAVRYSELAHTKAQAAGDDRLAVQVRATLGQAKAAAAQYGPALQLLDEAIAIKRSHRSGAGQTAVGLAYSLATKGAALGDRGEFPAALMCFDEALQVVHGARHEVHASIHGLRAAVLLWQGDWGAARESANEACAIGTQVRSLFTLVMGKGAAAYAQWMLESEPKALEDIKRATDWLQPRGITLFLSFNHGWLADGYASLGQRKEARSEAARALNRARGQDFVGGAMASRAIARLCAQEGDVRRTARWIARARAIAERRESRHEHAVTTLCEGEIAIFQSERERALSCLQFALQEFSAMGMRWHCSRAIELQKRMDTQARSTTLHSG